MIDKKHNRTRLFFRERMNMKRRTLVNMLPLLGLACTPLGRAQSLATARPSVNRSVQSSDGTRIAYAVTGNGPSLVLLHGLMGTRQSWYTSGYVDALANDYRLVLVDMRGHGESEGPADPQAYAYASLAADIAAVVEQECEEPPSLWGYSAGGGLAMACVAHYPDLYSRVVIGGSYRAAIGFPEGATDGMVANARRIAGMAALPAADVPANMRNQNIAAVAAFLEKGSYFDPQVQAKLKQFARPALLYLGAEDAAQMHAQEQAVGGTITDFFADLTYVELPGALSHGEAFDKSDVVLPYTLPFLATN
jgi:pimeloyl-ACP methyl ester carboxylesterase